MPPTPPHIGLLTAAGLALGGFLAIWFFEEPINPAEVDWNTFKTNLLLTGQVF